jgi:hypothetical protein
MENQEEVLDPYSDEEENNKATDGTGGQSKTYQLLNLLGKSSTLF